MSTTHNLLDTFLAGLFGQYEKKTGLNGIGVIGHGLIGEFVKGHIPNQSVDNTVLSLGAKLVEWVDKFKTEDIQTPVTQQEIKQEPEVLKGMPFPGYQSEFRGRTGRIR